MLESTVTRIERHLRRRGLLRIGENGDDPSVPGDDAKVGLIELSIKDKETVHVPVWAGVAAIAAGVVLLLARKKE